MKRNVIAAIPIRRYVGKAARAFAGLLILTGILLAGCSNPFDPPDNGKASGSGSTAKGGMVRIVIDSGPGGDARTLQPAASALAGYRLTFPYSNRAPVDLTTGNSAEVYLPDGSNAITATAYRAGGTVGNSGDAAASGSIYVTLSGGVVTSNNGVVPPIILYPSSGSGTLEYSITSPAAVSGTMKLWNIYGSLYDDFGTSGVLTIGASPSLSAQTSSLATGRYIMEIRLVNGNGDIALLREVVEIWTGTTTAIVFTPDVYLDPSALPVNGGAVLSPATVIGGLAIGEPGTGSGEDEANAVNYSVNVLDINNADQSFVLKNDSLFADISWIANTGTEPGDTGYSKTPVTDFSTNTVLWVKVVSENVFTTRYYKFTLATLDSELTVVSSDGLYTYAGDTLRITGNGTYAIGMKTGGATTTKNRIEVASGVTADITLNGVKIDMSGSNGAAFNMTGAMVQLTLNGANELKGSNYRAGLEAPEGSTLTIDATDETHSLTATGSSSGAGIGGGSYGNGGTITISGGTVTANGSHGAGIGGGEQGNGGIITISGGTVTVNGSSDAGIGGGWYGNGGTITISGSTVTVNGSSNAGIGGGYQGNGGIITISDSTVTATGVIGGTDGTVTINGSTVTARGVISVAGLSGNAVVFASSIQPALIVGVNATQAIAFNGTVGVVYGDFTLPQDIEIPAGSTLSVPAFSVLTIPSETTLTNNGTIIRYPNGVINGTVTGNQPGSPDLTISGDSSYTYVGGILTITGNGTYTIAMNGGVFTTSDHVVVSAGVSANITLNEVSLPPFDMSGATVQLTLSGTNTLQGGVWIPEGSSLTINAADDTQSLTATGGIDGGGTIIINGGTITSNTSGNYSAGIGGGIVRINGGTITATGGPRAAGISGGIITINGGTVTATGGVDTSGPFGNPSFPTVYGGAGIGGGSGSAGGTITITGGTVTATGGNASAYGGAGIGGGGYSAGGTVTITGGMVTATYIGGGMGSSYYGVADGPPGTIALSGNAVVFAPIQPTLTAGDNATGGIAFNGAAGTMYGDVTLQQDLTIPNTHTLDLVGHTLTVGSVTLTNEGTINKNGGTIAGTVGGGGTVNN
jgi:hypothetical protein